MQSAISFFFTSFSSSSSLSFSSNSSLLFHCLPLYFFSRSFGFSSLKKLTSYLAALFTFLFLYLVKDAIKFKLNWSRIVLFFWTISMTARIPRDNVYSEQWSLINCSTIYLTTGANSSGGIRSWIASAKNAITFAISFYVG
jgi:hypothetical protein